MTQTATGAGATLERLLEVIRLLREHCPWMGELTHESLAEYLVEECYELLEVIEGPAGRDDLRSELGDVLLQVILHARLQEERGSFGMTGVLEGLTAKMIRRNPHVFTADGELQQEFPATTEEIEAAWYLLKRAERPTEVGIFDSIPSRLPALAFAAKTVARARRERPGVTATHGPGRFPETEEELGEALLNLVDGAVGSGLDPERALRLAVRRYQEAHPGTAPKRPARN